MVPPNPPQVPLPGWGLSTPRATALGRTRVFLYPFCFQLSISWAEGKQEGKTSPALEEDEKEAEEEKEQDQKTGRGGKKRNRRRGGRREGYGGRGGDRTREDKGGEERGQDRTGEDKREDKTGQEGHIP